MIFIKKENKIRVSSVQNFENNLLSFVGTQRDRIGLYNFNFF